MRGLLYLILGQAVLAKKKDVPCVWKSPTGAVFDLRSLTRSSKEPSYYIKDGDIPCTPEIEPTYSFVWNFCAQVTSESFPSVCDQSSQQAAALQYVNRADGYQECEVIGHYEANRDDIYYSHIDVSDPSKGVSMKYPDGTKCPSDKLRSVTLDVLCDNVEMAIVSALEPNVCEYHVVMKSYRGCPTSCPITSHGLCNSHGHCAFDESQKKSYCFCNKGYSGESCTKDSEEAETTYDGYSVQITLLVVLLLVTVALIGVTGYMIRKITLFRQEQADDYYSLSQEGTEMANQSF